MNDWNARLEGLREALGSDLPARMSDTRVAMPYSDNTWYHVTDRSRLPQIAQQGLVGSEQGTDRVWKDAPVEDQAVYMWPNVNQAWAYSQPTPQPSWQMGWQEQPAKPHHWQDPVLLRIRDIDRSRLAPDHEQFHNHYIGPYAEQKEQAEYDEDAADLYNRAQPYIRAYFQKMGVDPDENHVEINGKPGDPSHYQHAVNILREMPADLREEIARHLSQRNGDAVMHYGPIRPEQIDVGSLNVYNEDNDYPGFEYDVPEPNYEDEDEDAYEKWIENRDLALDDWMAQQGNWVMPGDQEGWHSWGIDDPEDDSNSNSFTWKPIHHFAKTAAPEDWSPVKIEQLAEPYEFQIPQSVEQRFVQASECPHCAEPLRRSPGGVYCSYCGWEPRAKVAFDWSNLMGGVHQHRRPWWVDMSNPNDPNPMMWIGDPGSTHPYPLPISHQQRPSTILGVIDESTNPPTFDHYVSSNHPNAGLADTALAHVQRAYYQMKDDPSKRTAARDPIEVGGVLPNHPWHDPEWLESRSDLHSPYGDDQDPDFMSIPILTTPEGAWWVGGPGQSHAYHEQLNWGADDLRIPDDWDTRQKMQGNANASGNEYRLHMPAHTPEHVIPDIKEKVLRRIENLRRYEWGLMHEKRMLGEIEHPYGDHGYDDETGEYLTHQDPAPGYHMWVEHPDQSAHLLPVNITKDERGDVVDPYDAYHRQMGWPVRDNGFGGNYVGDFQPHAFVAPDGFVFGVRPGTNPYDWRLQRDQEKAWDREHRQRVEDAARNAWLTANPHMAKTAADFDPTRGVIVQHKGEERNSEPPFDKRKVYLYDPEQDVLHWAHPGQWHGDIKRDVEDWYAQRGLDTRYSDLMAGAVGETPMGDKIHGIYGEYLPSYGGKSGNEYFDKIYDRLHELTGVPITPNTTPDSMLDLLSPPDAGMGWASSDWKIASDGADYLTQSGDDWWGPQSVNLQHVNVPGQAPGMGDTNDPAAYRNPCWCDVGPSPHEWTPACENGKRPTLEHEAAVLPNGWIKQDPDLGTEQPDSWDDGTQWDTDTFLDHDIINQHLKTRQQAQEYLDWQERQKRREQTEWPSMGVKKAGMWMGDLQRATNKMCQIVWEETRNAENPDWPNWYNPQFPAWDQPPMSDQRPPLGPRPESEGISQRAWDLQHTLRALPAIDVPANVQEAIYHAVKALTQDDITTAVNVLRAVNLNNAEVRAVVREFSQFFASFPHTVEKPWGTDKDWNRPVYPDFSHPDFPEGYFKVGSRFRPERRTGADNVPGMPQSDSGHWVWLDGHVGFGDHHHEIAKSLAMQRGYDPTQTNYISNMIARNQMPEGHAVAVGTLKRGYPHIWMSTRDRNAVWDDVMRARDTQPIVKSAGVKDDARRAWEDLTANGGFSLTRDLAPANGQAYFASYEQPTEIIPLPEFSPEAIIQWRQQVMSMLKADTQTLIGGWVDAGMVYLDVSRAFQDRDAAIAFGQANHQKAIWDGFNNVEIRLDEGYQEIREARVRKLGWAVQFMHPIYSPTLADDNERTAADAHQGEEFPAEPDSLMKYTDEVPVSLLLPAREWQRGPGQQNFDREDTWQPLVEDIKTRGFMSPVWLEWSSKTGMAYIGEGNTRIAVAVEAGIPTVPVAVYRKTEIYSNGGEIGPFKFDKRQWLIDEGYDPNASYFERMVEDPYVPQYFKPHYLIGFMQRTSAVLDPGTLSYAVAQVARLMRSGYAQGESFFHIAQGAQQYIMQNWPHMDQRQQDQVLQQAARMAQAETSEPSIQDQQHMIWNQPPSHLIPQYNEPRWSSVAKQSDFQGRTNWETWNTGLMIDNERETNEQARAIVEQGVAQGLDDNAIAAKLRDWAIPAIIGPNNQQSIESAKEWNSIPPEERLDYNYEEFKDKHGDNPTAMDLIHNLGGGPDVSDTEPTLIDPELVNWLELVQGIKDEFEEDAEFERREQQAQSQGIDWASNGGDNYDKMRDAIYRHYGAQPDSELEKAGISRFDNPNAYFNMNVTLPPHEFLQTNPNWDNYIEPKSRIPIWNINRKRNPNSPNPDKDIDWNDPEIRQHLEADPNYQNIMQNGHTQRLHDYADDLMYAITHGTNHPHIPVMQQALQARGYTPEQIQEIMQQRWRWNPGTQEWVDLTKNYDAPPPVDKTLDQPGDFTLPEGWTAKKRK